MGLLVVVLHFQVKANPEVCRAVLRIDDYVNIHTLVTYYQMVSNTATDSACCWMEIENDVE